MNGVERDTGIFPPVAYAPVATAASPFKACRSNSSLIASAGDGLVEFSNKVLDRSEISFAVDA